MQGPVATDLYKSRPKCMPEALSAPLPVRVCDARLDSTRGPYLPDPGGALSGMRPSIRDAWTDWMPDPLLLRLPAGDAAPIGCEASFCGWHTRSDSYSMAKSAAHQKVNTNFHSNVGQSRGTEH